jgi:hypothetical protein
MLNMVNQSFLHSSSKADILYINCMMVTLPMAMKHSVNSGWFSEGMQMLLQWAPMDATHCNAKLIWQLLQL